MLKRDALFVRVVVGTVFAALLIGAVMASRPVATKPKNTVGLMGYPNGVWPSRVQPFADRLVEARAGRLGSVQLYFMNASDKQFSALDQPTLQGEAISANGDATPVVLRAEAMKNHPGAGSWHYVGNVPIARIQTNNNGLFGLRVTIPYKDVNHSVVWKPEQTSIWIHRHGGDAVMPEAPSNAVEEKLFLVPGGKYTAADIAANGNAIASVRYRGMMPAHNFKPTKGAIICPITQTVANPQFTWIIDGKTYRFCCPPCIAEFVRQAKEKPKTIHPPAFYTAK